MKLCHYPNVHHCCFRKQLYQANVHQAAGLHATHIALNQALPYNRKKRYYISLHPDYSEAQEEQDRD